MADEYIRREDAIKIAERYGLANGSVLGRHTGLADCIASEILSLPAADVAPVVRLFSAPAGTITAANAGRRWMEGTKVNESAADWGLVFDTLLLMAFLQSDAETPEAAAEKFVRKLLDIPEDVDLRTETPEERHARSDKWYAQK